MTAGQEEFAAWLIARVQTGHATSKFTSDPVVTMTLWAVDLDKPGHFVMLPDQARVLAYALIDSAARAETGDHEP